MKITDLKVYQVDLPLHEGNYTWSEGKRVDVFDSTIVQIDTDSGVTGFGEVCRTITDRQVDPQFSLAEQLASLSDQVIILCPSLDLLNRIAKKRGSKNLYAELAYFPNRHILQFARDKNLPVVATNRVFFCQPKRTGADFYCQKCASKSPPRSW